MIGILHVLPVLPVLQSESVHPGILIPSVLGALLVDLVDAVLSELLYGLLIDDLVFGGLGARELLLGHKQDVLVYVFMPLCAVISTVLQLQLLQHVPLSDHRQLPVLPPPHDLHDLGSRLP